MLSIPRRDIIPPATRKGANHFPAAQITPPLVVLSSPHAPISLRTPARPFRYAQIAPRLSVRTSWHFEMLQRFLRAVILASHDVPHDVRACIPACRNRRTEGVECFPRAPKSSRGRLCGDFGMCKREIGGPCGDLGTSERENQARVPPGSSFVAFFECLSVVSLTS
jgi:hypothetical protein